MAPISRSAWSNSQQPVDWPEFTTQLQNGTSVSGQTGAYHFLSYYLITQYYIPDAAGNYLDDIHYYFTGSNNTYIDYHSFDPLGVGFPGWGEPPANTPYPSQKVACYHVDTNGNCTWNDPVSGQQYVFSPLDYAAVKYQLHLEVIDLVNVLQFMVSGSVNMKDIIAAGNANTALALIGAADTLDTGTLQPSSSTPVNVSADNIITGARGAWKVVSQPGSACRSRRRRHRRRDYDFGANCSRLQVRLRGDCWDLPRRPAFPAPITAFRPRIGQLANSNLQSQFSAAFDTTVDNILGDWNKLSQIGPEDYRYQ